MLRTVDLRVEFTVNPLGLDKLRSRFSWIPVSNLRGRFQRAYRIIVGSIDNVLKGVGDIWDSRNMEFSNC
jgi:alpha-L-rhamnosidase